MTRMVAKLLLYFSDSGAVNLIAKRIHTVALLSIQLTHECHRSFKCFLRYYPLVPDTRHGLDISVIALKKLYSFPLSFTREGGDGITACNRVYADEGFHELPLLNASVKLLLQSANNLRKFYYPGLFAPSLFYIALSKVPAMRKQKDKHISIITVDDVRASRVPSMENRARISFFVIAL